MKAKPTNKPGSVTIELSRKDDPLLEAANRMALTPPFRIKKILVPVDFSDCSKKALQYALPLAKEHGAAVTLLYVLPSTYSAAEYARFDYAQWEASMTEDAKKEMAQLLPKAAADGVPAESMVRVGSAGPEIIEAARNLPADLVVIGTHGRTGLKHVFLGSVTESVVQRAPCPVLVVREREREIL